MADTDMTALCIVMSQPHISLDQAGC